MDFGLDTEPPTTDEPLLVQRKNAVVFRVGAGYTVPQTTIIQMSLSTIENAAGCGSTVDEADLEDDRAPCDNTDKIDTSDYNDDMAPDKSQEEYDEGTTSKKDGIDNEDDDGDEDQASIL